MNPILLASALLALQSSPEGSAREATTWEGTAWEGTVRESVEALRAAADPASAQALAVLLDEFGLDGSLEPTLSESIATNPNDRFAISVELANLDTNYARAVLFLGDALGTLDELGSFAERPLYVSSISASMIARPAAPSRLREAEDALDAAFDALDPADSAVSVHAARAELLGVRVDLELGSGALDRAGLAIEDGRAAITAFRSAGGDEATARQLELGLLLSDLDLQAAQDRYEDLVRSAEEELGRGDLDPTFRAFSCASNALD